MHDLRLCTIASTLHRQSRNLLAMCFPQRNSKLFHDMGVCCHVCSSHILCINIVHLPTPICSFACPLTWHAWCCMHDVHIAYAQYLSQVVVLLFVSPHIQIPQVRVQLKDRIHPNTIWGPNPSRLYASSRSICGMCTLKACTDYSMCICWAQFI